MAMVRYGVEAAELLSALRARIWSMSSEPQRYEQFTGGFSRRSYSSELVLQWSANG